MNRQPTSGPSDRSLEIDYCLTDVPLPVMAVSCSYKGKKVSRESTDSQFLLMSQSKPAEISEFYAREMPLYGWQLVFENLNIAHVHVFNKPERCCVIAIYPADMIVKKIIKNNNALIVISYDFVLPANPIFLKRS